MLRKSISKGLLMSKVLGLFSSENIKKIEIIVSKSNDIHFNLAAEEYLYERPSLRNPILLIYRNSHTVVIGTYSSCITVRLSLKSMERVPCLEYSN